MVEVEGHGVAADEAAKRAPVDDPTARVAEFWGNPEREEAGVAWIEIPRVATSVNRRATGDPSIDWLTHSEQFMGALPKPRRALSLGCGTGIIERAVRERDVCQRIDGLDVAEGAIERASALAAESGLTGLEYRVADLNRDELPPDAYDVVYAHAILHHIFALEHVLDQVRRTLRPGGLLVLYEYVGPAQMQFPREHLELADALLRAIPRAYRRHVRPGLDGTKDSAPRVSIADMNATDPSEAIRASEILTLAASRFEIRHVRSIGGTLLMLILNEIAANFRDDDPEAQAIVASLVYLENVLIDSGVLSSYHAYAVCEKTNNVLPAQTQGVSVWRQACALPRPNEAPRLPTLHTVDGSDRTAVLDDGRSVSVEMSSKHDVPKVAAAGEPGGQLLGSRSQTLDVIAMRELAVAFSLSLDVKKAEIDVGFPWYPYSTLSNFVWLEQLLTGERRQLLDLIGEGPIADIGAGDGDVAFFLAGLGRTTDIVDYGPTNYNGLRGARLLKQALASPVSIHEIDLDTKWELPRQQYAAVFFLGILYHLKNPYYALEALARATRYCILSTRIARFTPDKRVDLSGVPAAYLLDPVEANNDGTNYWIFSDVGLRRIFARTGWEVCDYLRSGNTRDSDPASAEGDERAFCLLRSARVV
jgi:tRNA (mo5U34)-methyltransferase